MSPPQRCYIFFPALTAAADSQPGSRSRNVIFKRSDSREEILGSARSGSLP